LAVATAGFSQGTVAFSNIGTGTAISNGVNFAVLPAGTQFRAALYYLPERGTDWTLPQNQAEFLLTAFQLGASANNFVVAGQFTAGTRTTPVAADPNGTAGGTPAYFQVRAWSAAFATYELAVGSGSASVFAGASKVLFMPTGNPLASPAVAPKSLVIDGGMKGFYVTPVPEPAAIGLGILGVGALWLLRRRK